MNKCDLSLSAGWLQDSHFRWWRWWTFSSRRPSVLSRLSTPKVSRHPTSWWPSVTSLSTLRLQDTHFWWWRRWWTFSFKTTYGTSILSSLRTRDSQLMFTKVPNHTGSQQLSYGYELFNTSSTSDAWLHKGLITLLSLTPRQVPRENLFLEQGPS